MTLVLKTIIGVFFLWPDLHGRVLEESALSPGETVLDV